MPNQTIIPVPATNELLLETFEFLSVQELTKLEPVSKDIQRLAKHNYLWRKHYDLNYQPLCSTGQFLLDRAYKIPKSTPHKKAKKALLALLNSYGLGINNIPNFYANHSDFLEFLELNYYNFREEYPKLFKLSHQLIMGDHYHTKTRQFNFVIPNSYKLAYQYAQQAKKVEFLLLALVLKEKIDRLLSNNLQFRIQLEIVSDDLNLAPLLNLFKRYPLLNISHLLAIEYQTKLPLLDALLSCWKRLSATAENSRTNEQQEQLAQVQALIMNITKLDLSNLQDLNLLIPLGDKLVTTPILLILLQHSEQEIFNVITDLLLNFTMSQHDLFGDESYFVKHVPTSLILQYMANLRRWDASQGSLILLQSASFLARCDLSSILKLLDNIKFTNFENLLASNSHFNSWLIQQPQPHIVIILRAMVSNRVCIAHCVINNPNLFNRLTAAPFGTEEVMSFIELLTAYAYTIDSQRAVFLSEPFFLWLTQQPVNIRLQILAKLAAKNLLNYEKLLADSKLFSMLPKAPLEIETAQLLVKIFQTDSTSKKFILSCPQLLLALDTNSINDLFNSLLIADRKQLLDNKHFIAWLEKQALDKVYCMIHSCCNVERIPLPTTLTLTQSQLNLIIKQVNSDYFLLTVGELITDALQSNVKHDNIQRISVIISQLAKLYISPQTKKRLAALAEQDPDYANLLMASPSADFNEYLLARRAKQSPKPAPNDKPANSLDIQKCDTTQAATSAQLTIPAEPISTTISNEIHNANSFITAQQAVIEQAVASVKEASPTHEIVSLNLQDTANTYAATNESHSQEEQASAISYGHIHNSPVNKPTSRINKILGLLFGGLFYGFISICLFPITYLISLILTLPTFLYMGYSLAETTGKTQSIPNDDDSTTPLLLAAGLPVLCLSPIIAACATAANIACAFTSGCIRGWQAGITQLASFTKRLDDSLKGFNKFLGVIFLGFSNFKLHLKELKASKKLAEKTSHDEHATKAFSQLPANSFASALKALLPFRQGVNPVIKTPAYSSPTSASDYLRGMDQSESTNSFENLSDVSESESIIPPRRTIKSI